MQVTEKKWKRQEMDYIKIKKVITDMITDAVISPESWVNKKWIQIPAEMLYNIKVTDAEGNPRILHIHSGDMERYCTENYLKFRSETYKDGDAYRTMFLIKIGKRFE